MMKIYPISYRNSFSLLLILLGDTNNLRSICHDPDNIDVSREERLNAGIVTRGGVSKKLPINKV